jgi:hypothetical protein
VSDVLFIVDSSVATETIGDIVLSDVGADEPPIEREDTPEDGPLLETIVPQDVAASRLMGHVVQATLSSTQEGTSRETDSDVGYGVRIVRLLEELRHELLASARGGVPDTPELPPITAQDAEAITNAYFEDDLSDEERSRLFGNTDDPAVTIEEADIDRTLWQLHVD